MVQRYSKHFELVLVLEYFRSATPHLCLIQALSNRYRIGLYLVPLSVDLQAKAGDAQARFVTTCVEAGAEIVNGQGNSCDLMIVQQRPYSNETVQRIFSAVRARRVTGLMALAMAGLEVHEAYLTAVTQSLLDRAAAVGHIPPIDTASVAHVLAGLGREFSRPEVAEIAHASPKETADAIADLILEGLTKR